MRTHKYGAKACEIDGIRFPSQAEGRRYQELRLLERAGEIQDLALQPVFVLRAPSVSGEPVMVGKYRGDFEYFRLGTRIVEDVKGYDTALSKWKRRHVEAQYGVTVVIV